MPSPRYAIYWTPRPDSPLWRLGCAWLGRDARGGQAAPPRPQPLHDADDLAQATAEPARYGWHATLKAPFRLAPGADEAAMHDRLRAFCARQQAFAVRLEATTLDDFVALRPAEPSLRLQALADEAIAEFDLLRAPLDDAERAQGDKLPPPQRERFERWGYAQVFGGFRFHCSLTASLEDTAKRAAWLARARQVFDAQLAHPVDIDGVALFVEPVPDAPLDMPVWLPFGAGRPPA